MTAPLAVLGETPAGAPDVGEPLPHVVAWNLTRRCNLQCAHCYIAAGPDREAGDELTTAECRRIMDEILQVNPSPMFILSGGEPLLREDLPTLVRHAVAGGATVVVGTNGTLLTETKIEELKAAGVTGMAVSVESLNPKYHDRFRRGHGSLDATLSAITRLVSHRLDFVIQTTLTRGNRDELEALVAWAAEQGAVSFNAYFLVSTGRALGMEPLTPADREALLEQLVDLHTTYLGRMMVRAKCAPQFMRLVHERAPSSPVLQYATRCPCGVQYCRITPDGELTACPYLPVSVGSLREQSFGTLWREAALFRDLRAGSPGGKCGRCGYREMCGGCRAGAYATDGTWLGEDPSCAYEPVGKETLVARPPAVRYGAQVRPGLTWTPEAEARIQRIPSFVRGVIVERLESYARREGYAEVTVELMRRVRRTMPIDFSQRMPFFLRDD